MFQNQFKKKKMKLEWIRKNKKNILKEPINKNKKLVF